MDQQMSIFSRYFAKTALSAIIMALTAAGIAFAFFPKLSVSIPRLRSGDKPMNHLNPIQIYDASKLLDITSGSHAGIPYLMAIEYSREASQAWRGNPTNKTLWRLWKWDEPTKRFRQSSESWVGMPRAKAVSIGFSRDRLLTLLEANQKHAAFLGAWKIADLGAASIPEISSAVLPLDLSEAEALQVHIDLTYLWSSAALPPAEWLFNPHLALLADGSNVAALNTADAHAILWKFKDATVGSRPMAFLRDVLEPVTAAGGSSLLLFYRKPSPDWSVFYQASRYSKAMGPTALPLLLAELDDQGNMPHPRNLSKDPGMGDVFSFGVSQEKRRLALAAVSGSKEAPFLRLYLSSDLGRTFQELAAAPLPMVPYRLSVCAGESAVLVGVVYERTTDYQIQGFHVPYDTLANRQQP